MNKSRHQFWTFRYALINITYYAGFCTIHAYAAVYLLAHGFSNTEVGILLAVSNILSAVLQPFVAGIIDKPGWLTNRLFSLFSVIAIAVCSVLLMTVPENKILIFVIYAFLYMVQFVYQPVVTALCFEYQKAGCDIIYGLARGLGSAGFAVTSAFIGRLVEKEGVFVLLIAHVIIMALSAASLFTFKKPGDITESMYDTDAPAEAAHNNFFEFARVYPAFMLFLAGTICFFFAHNMINDFLIQIIRNLGGAETELGYATFLAAMLELPVMAVIGLVLKKVSADKLLILSGAAFFIKTLILVFAASIAMMFVSQSFQMLAYAVFVPASAYYVSRTMEDLDQVKGQAYVSSAITVGGVFSNLICGGILDSFGIHPMLVTGSVICAAGVIIT
ncbi:MAG: MFS transporter, partial [Lachnospiraceae bacterium]|nr:MFS transporter [Lachnospiraceae bacterium]